MCRNPDRSQARTTLKNLIDQDGVGISNMIVTKAQIYILLKDD